MADEAQSIDISSYFNTVDLFAQYHLSYQHFDWQFCFSFSEHTSFKINSQFFILFRGYLFNK